MTVERTAIETLNCPEIDRAISDLGLSDDHARRVSRRLSNMPTQWASSRFAVSLSDQKPEPPSALTEWMVKESFNEESAAWLLWTKERTGDMDRPWSDLSPDEKKRAQRLWRSLFLIQPYPAQAAPNLKGRPPLIDHALILYIMLVLEEACGRRFSISRQPATDHSPPNGILSGPMWRALMAALRHARGESDRHPEAVARAVRRLRSKAFRDHCSHFGLRLDAKSVADHPADYRIIASSVRAPY
jgi:hypothetical protein